MRTRFCLFAPIALAIAGCASGGAHTPAGPDSLTKRDPSLYLSILASTSTPADSRKQADALLVQQKGKTDPARLDVLEQLLYAPGHSDEMRIYAMDQLADADPARAGRALELYLPKFEGDANAVLKHACDLAIKLGDERLTAPLIRSLTRGLDSPATLRARPEPPAIEKLSGKPLNETLYATVESGTNHSTRIAALDILQQLDTRDAIVARINKMQPNDAWLIDLRWWLSLFNTPPIGETESLWMQYLHRPEFAPLVCRAAERHRALAHNPDYLFAPRFVAVLAYADDTSLASSKADLLASLEKQLATLKHIDRTPQYPKAPDDISETLAANQQKLSLCDLLAIRLLLTALADPGGGRNIAEFHRQGLDDLSDTTTEHGGLLALQNIRDPKLLITPFAPYYASNDFEYVSSDKLLQQTAIGLAQYHFHFQQIHNEERAGPGTGDLNYVRAQRCNAVVITSIDTRKINIDYYTPNGAVVDLGVYEVK